MYLYRYAQPCLSTLLLKTATVTPQCLLHKSAISQMADCKRQGAVNKSMFTFHIKHKYKQNKKNIQILHYCFFFAGGNIGIERERHKLD